ncbi:MAG: cell division protein FtsA [Proteobacteria bacterium]|nr:cell division protein FtsA [Pseudomonadota bacterium]
MPEHELIAGLDIGTTKVCAIVAEQTEDGIDIIGIGSVPSRGLKKGVVVNIESTVQAIRSAIDQAETMAGCEIGTVYAGIAGSHVRGMNKEGVAAISEREVSEQDVQRVLEQSKAIPLPGDRQVLHVLPQEYIVDEQDGIREPVGISGVRLEARVHLVTAANASVQNIIKCCQRCDLDVAEVVLEPIASAEAALSEDEKEIGAVLIDIGGGTTDVIIFINGAVVHTSVIPIGGINLTNDVATGLRTPIAEAERIKIKYGCADSSMIDEEETIEVPSVGGRAPRSLPRQVLSNIVEPRMEEILSAIHHVIAETGYLEMLFSGAVITGGTTLLDGTCELAEKILGVPVRRGSPAGVGGLVDVVRSPAFATGVGLVKYGAGKVRETPGKELVVPIQSGWGLRLGSWLREVF